MEAELSQAQKSKSTKLALGQKRKIATPVEVPKCSREEGQRPLTVQYPKSVTKGTTNVDDADLEQRKNSAISKLQAHESRCYASKEAAVVQAKDTVDIEAARNDWIRAIKRRREIEGMSLEAFKIWEEKFNQPAEPQRAETERAETTDQSDNNDAKRISHSVQAPRMAQAREAPPSSSDRNKGLSKYGTKRAETTDQADNNDTKRISHSVQAPRMAQAREAPPSSSDRNKGLSKYETKLLTYLNEFSSKLKVELESNVQHVHKLRLSHQKSAEKEALHWDIIERAKEELRFCDEALQKKESQSYAHALEKACAFLD